MSTVNEITSHEIEGVEDFEHVLSIDTIGSYEWDSLEAWYSPSRRRFFWIEDSGCSCNYLGQDVWSLSDFLDGDRDALLRAVRSKYENAYSPALNECERDMAVVRDYQFGVRP